MQPSLKSTLALNHVINDILEDLDRPDTIENRIELLTEIVEDFENNPPTNKLSAKMFDAASYALDTLKHYAAHGTSPLTV